MASTTALAQEYYPGDQPQMVTVSAANLAVMSRRIEALETSLGLKDGKDGKEMWEDVSGQNWSHTWGGRMYGDYATFADQNAASLGRFGDIDNYVEFRSLRLFVEGEGYGIYDYKFQVEFEPDREPDRGLVDAPGVAIKDMYFGIHEVPYAGYVRFGHYKAPFSLEEMTHGNDITFMERSLQNIFAPSREVGISSFNSSANQNWTWAGGVFVDSLSETTYEVINDNIGTSFVGRATWTPYYDEPSNGRYLMHVGLNGRYTDDRDDVMRFRATPEVNEGPFFIDTGNISGDWWTAVGPEAAIVWGPFSIQAEYTAVQVDDAVAGTTRDFHGAYVYGSWFLTGESRSYDRGSGVFGRVNPYTNFWIVRGAGVGTGAIELAARWSYLDLSGVGYNPAVRQLPDTQGAGSGSMNDVTLGVNWYWNPHTRWMFNYIHTWNEYDSGEPNPENDIVAVRGQIDF
ncbi:MAG: OprO/OprP family phosphate-selective porin [Pirellulaceae bacterium]